MGGAHTSLTSLSCPLPSGSHTLYLAPSQGQRTLYQRPPDPLWVPASIDTPHVPSCTPWTEVVCLCVRSRASRTEDRWSESVLIFHSPPSCLSTGLSPVPAGFKDSEQRPAWSPKRCFKERRGRAWNMMEKGRDTLGTESWFCLIILFKLP